MSLHYSLEKRFFFLNFDISKWILLVESWDIVKVIYRTVLRNALREGNTRERLAAYTYRTPMLILDTAIYVSGDVYAKCPRCRVPLERDFQSYCDRCGQALDWSMWDELQDR